MGQNGIPMSIAVIFSAAIVGTMFFVGIIIAAMFFAS